MKCPKCGYKINAAAQLARRRAKSLTKERRVEIAKKAIAARWGKVKISVVKSGKGKK